MQAMAITPKSANESVALETYNYGKVKCWLKFATLRQLAVDTHLASLNTGDWDCLMQPPLLQDLLINGCCPSSTALKAMTNLTGLTLTLPRYSGTKELLSTLEDLPKLQRPSWRKALLGTCILARAIHTDLPRF